MFHDKRFEVTRFPQQRAYYCGPASAQIFLSLTRFSIKSPQSVAFDVIKRNNLEPDNWYSDPSGLSSYINDLLPNTKALRIRDVDTSQDQLQIALNQINYTISFLEIPCITLVLAGNHWIVVDGLRYEVSPNGTKDIVAFFIRDPWATSPDFSYVTISEFCQTRFLPNKIGEKWKDKYIILTQPTSEELLVTNPKNVIPLGGGAGRSPQDLALLNLELHGFENVKPIQGGGAPVFSPISVTGLDGATDYSIIPLDATQTREFQDFVYSAIELSTDTLLETARLSDVLQIFTNEEMLLRLEELFPGRSFQIEDGFFWKPCFELRSRLAVARRFRLEGESMFLLPDGSAAKVLSDFAKGG